MADDDTYNFEVNLEGVTFMGVQIGDEMNISAHGGDYDGARSSFTTEDLDSGLPLQLAPPARLPDEGRTRRVRPGLYASTADMEFLVRWYRNGEEIAGEHGHSYTITAADEGRTIEYREAPSSIHGSPVAAPYVVTIQSGYEEVGLRVDDSTSFMTPWPGRLASTCALAFISLEAPEKMNHRAFCGKAADSLYIAASQILTMGGKGHAFPNTSSRVHILGCLHGTTDGKLTFEAIRWRGGGLDTVAAHKDAGAFFRNNNGIWLNDSPAPGSSFTVYRAAMWDLTSYQGSGGAMFDVGSRAMQDLFWADGILRDPAESVAEYGQPLVDIYGPAAYLNGGQHYGSLGSGTFKTVNGTLTEA